MKYLKSNISLNNRYMFIKYLEYLKIQTVNKFIVKILI
jgi:hypothetical protein